MILSIVNLRTLRVEQRRRSPFLHRVVRRDHPALPLGFASMPAISRARHPTNDIEGR